VKFTMRSYVAWVSAVALVLLLAPAASAKPLVRERFTEKSSEVEDDFCGDLTVRIDVDIRGSALFNPHGPDGLAYSMENVHGSVSFTNLANNKSYTGVFNFINKDQKVTDNGDGTLTILVMATGSEKWYGPDGKLLFNDPGQTRFEVLIDHGGTPTDPSDDEFITDLGVVKGSTGRNDLDGRDFCEDIHEFIG
jgi:hypothetical protein